LLLDLLLRTADREVKQLSGSCVSPPDHEYVVFDVQHDGRAGNHVTDIIFTVQKVPPAAQMECPCRKSATCGAMRVTFCLFLRVARRKFAGCGFGGIVANDLMADAKTILKTDLLLRRR
jgi:hypothetical protein